MILVKKHKATSPGKRGHIAVVDTSLHKGAPYKPLLVAKKKINGRNSLGRITVRHRGGGHKRHYRLIDWKRDKDDIAAKIERFEYDPNRSASIALLLYKDGERRYIIKPKGVSVGDEISSGPQAMIRSGNCLPLSCVPLGSMVHCVELKPGKGAQLARSAGCAVQLLAKDGNYVTLRMRSGEMRKVLSSCRAVMGEVDKSEHNLAKQGKAGRKRWQGIRPTTRGVAMNPVDHPLGGGEGRTSGGRPPCSPWGIPEGKKTRKRKKPSSRLIVRRRRNKSEK